MTVYFKDGVRATVSHSSRPGYLEAVGGVGTNQGYAQTKSGSTTYTCYANTKSTHYYFSSWAGSGTSTNPYYPLCTADSYAISVAASPAGGGSVSGDDTYDYGDPCTISASPAANYSFSGWYEGSTYISGNEEYSFTVTKARSFTAKFTYNPPPSYTISVAASPAGGGTVGGGGSYTSGSACTISASPATDYVFSGWYEGETYISGNEEYTFTVKKARSFTAKFTYVPPTYYLKINVNTYMNGVYYRQGSTGDFTYITSTITVSSTSSTAYQLYCDIYSNTEQYSYTTTSSTSSSSPDSVAPSTSTASYDPEVTRTTNSYAISVIADPTEGGSVSGDDTYDYGDPCTISASPNANYVFSGWYEGETYITGNEEYTFTVTKARSFTAKFTCIVHYLNINVNDYINGVYYRQGSSGDYTYITSTTTVQSTSSTAYQLYCSIYSNTAQYSYSTTSSTSSSSPDSVSPSTSTTGSTYNPTVTQSLNYYNITTSVVRGSGTTSGGGSIGYDKSTNISASASSGYEFQKWDDDNTSPSRVVVCDGAKNYGAIFWSTANYTLSYSTEHGTAPSSIQFRAGQDVTLAGYMSNESESRTTSHLTFYHNDGTSEESYVSGYTYDIYQHISWKFGDTTYTPGTTKENMPNQNVTMVAQWSQASEPEVGNVTTPVAPTRSGYTFQGWKSSSSKTVYPANTSYNPVIYSDFYGTKNFDAVWLKNVHSYSFVVDDGEWTSGGVLNPGGVTSVSADGTTISASGNSYIVTNENTSASTTITPVPNTNWVFDKWTRKDPTGHPYNYTAIFKKEYSTITVRTSSSYYGTVDPSGEFSWEVDSQHNITATPVDDRSYVFASWNGTIYDNPYTVYVGNEDATYTAYWVKRTYKVNYDGNGGTPTQAYQQDVWGTELIATATRPGYEFNGWWTSASGGTEVTTIETNPNDEYTVYAHWIEQVILTVNVHRFSDTEGIYAGGYVKIDNEPTTPVRGGSYSKTVLVGVNHVIHAIDESGGYSRFTEWTYDTSSTSSEKDLTVAINSDKAYTATFKRYKTDIKFHTSSSVTVITTAYAGLPYPTAEIASDPSTTEYLYVFNGYYTGENGTGTKYYNSDYSPVSGTWPIKSDTTIDLYPHWVRVYVMYADQGGGYGYDVFYEKLNYGWYSDRECTQVKTNLRVPPPGMDTTKYRFLYYSAYFQETSHQMTDEHGVITYSPTIIGSLYWSWNAQEIIWLTFNVYQYDARGYLRPISYVGKKSYDIAEGGSVAEPIDVTAYANTGYEFTKWIKNGVDFHDQPRLNFSPSRNDNGSVYEAVFDFVMCDLYTDYYDEHSKITPYNSSGNPYRYASGSTVTLSAYPYPSYSYAPDSFVRKIRAVYGEWSDISGSAGLYEWPVTLDEDSSRYVYGVRCSKHWSSVSLEAWPAGTVQGGDSRAEIGSTIYISALDRDGYVFEGWYINDVKQSSWVQTNQPYTVTSQDVVIVAKFRLRVSVTKDPNTSRYTTTRISSRDTGVNGCYDYQTGLFSYSAMDTNSLVPDTFKYWVVDGKQVASTKDPLVPRSHICEFNVTKPCTACAVFEDATAIFNITVLSSNPEKATVGGSDKYSLGKEAYIWCEANDPNYPFLYWQPDGNTNPKRKVKVMGDATYIAKIGGKHEEPLEPGEDLDWNPYYLPWSDDAGCGVPIGYNNYASYELNPITNWYYRQNIDPSAEIVNSNCTWFANGRVLQMSGRPDLAGKASSKASTWFDSAFKNVDGAEWPREGSMDYHSHEGEEISYFAYGDILCWDYIDEYGNSAGHIDIVEKVDYENNKLYVSFGWYPYFDGNSSDIRRYSCNWINMPTVGATGGGANWNNVYLQGVIHNPLAGNGSTQPTIKMFAIPEEAGKTYIDGVKTKSFEVGTEATLTYEVEPGHTWTKWWDGSTVQDKPYTVMTAQNLYAYFDNFDPIKNVYVSAKIIPEGIGIIHGGGTHTKGSDVTLTYELYDDASNYEFKGWSNGETSSTCILRNVQDAFTAITAEFNDPTKSEDDPAPIGDLMPCIGEGKTIELKELKFNIEIFKWDNGQPRGNIRPAMNLYINGIRYNSYDEGPVEEITETFTPTIMTDDIKIELAQEYLSSKDSLSIKSMSISYYGWDPYGGQKFYTRYYTGTSEGWTEWTEVTNE